jgi:hypothetical protein
MKLNTLKFAFAAGILGAFVYFLITLFALIGLPGFLPFATLLQQGYSFYGYSISVSGLFVGAIYGFLEGFVWLGVFALIYNKLLR